MSSVEIDIRGLETQFCTNAGEVTSRWGMNTRINEGETLCLAGTAPAGVTAHSNMRLLPASENIVAGVLRIPQAEGCA